MVSKAIYDISVIIPFKDKSKMTLTAVASLLQYGPSLKEIFLVSNNSSDIELQQIREGIKNYKNIQLLEYNRPFNYQKINNWAVQQTSGDYILFLNNDTELTKNSVGTIEHMYGLASKKDVGMVGCILLYGDGMTIQHAGVYLHPGSLGDHVYIGKPYKKALAAANSPTDDFPYPINEDRKLTAVTGAVQLVEKKKFDVVQGFDERFIIGGGDVDLCIRLNKAGYQTWIAHKGYIIHKESQSRSHKPIPYVDFYYSYLSYINGYDLKVGDPFVPKITKGMR